MNIQTIIKQSIKRLELEGKLLTPDFYAEAFCKEAAKAGYNVEDCTKLDKFKLMLNKDLQEELKKYHTKTISEFSHFLISKLNRTIPSHCSNLLESQIQFTKRVLQTIEVLHNKEASELSIKCFDLLSREPSPAEIDQYRQLWVNFLTTYDDTFLQNLKPLGDVDSKDLKKTIENLNIQNLPIGKSETFELSKVASLLVASLVPSIASDVNEKIADISQKIQKDPSLLESSTIENDIKSAIFLRIALDKQSVKEMIESIDGVLDKLSLRLIEMIESSDSSTVEIQKIKKELESYNESSSSSTNFAHAHKKLYTIAIALEENTQALTKDLKKHSSEVGILSKKIEHLEQELARAREESKEDFLTKLFNKRALEEFMNIKEAEFERYEKNFTVVFFDLDHFKAVNDTYGHDAGDAVLVAFSKILKKDARNVDIVGRYGGEEFVAILSETDTDGGIVFAQKIRNKVKNARFMYKSNRIELSVSAGVSERKIHASLQSTMKAADEALYKAKDNGRDRVESK
ncbi:diguanylate cyclase (GGDEF domain) [Sulfurimonas denitrificans DSM 1251]|uniref:diguanylate cyclase n=1 Tax=Sulfurimonas denitrificans (strain ATCC 33889 / DSM 1251) TaxID=326298 RepID=Q30Q84_SULDN|nr:GGDEF domain-containing protein [Sulfurimonas denitrificans]ABB44847.1 diguanylate cyclase (GGDEF domain) [Sulfurimonas denitrificans DSM 1251]